MDPRTNPYAPGAGTAPPELAGRDEIIERAAVALDRIRAGRAARSFMLYGLRGVGKTVLLNKILQDAEGRGILAVRIEAPEDRSLPGLVVRHCGRPSSVLAAARPCVPGPGRLGKRSVVSPSRSSSGTTTSSSASTSRRGAGSPTAEILREIAQTFSCISGRPLARVRPQPPLPSTSCNMFQKSNWRP